MIDAIKENQKHRNPLSSEYNDVDHLLQLLEAKEKYIQGFEKIMENLKSLTLKNLDFSLTDYLLERIAKKFSQRN